MENIVLKMYQTVNGVQNEMACINPKVVCLTDGYHIAYLEQDKTHVTMKISKDKCILFRKGIYSTSLHLNLMKPSYIKINSIYGNMESEIQCLEIVCQKDFWKIAYRLEDQLLIIKWTVLQN